ncbi:terpenoid synthase [Aspergillus alliaceus]|uniref:Terpenoid synthase n=1 Tax=Petromyces alliaceus TaxID=209559 RepID=A0A5N7BQK3_PETAA|nr:terpenoid synthase [Aspergillus alliaceus]
MATVSAESLFAYHGLETKTPEAAKPAHLEQVKLIIKEFLHAIQFNRNTPFIKDHDLEAAVQNYFLGLCMGEHIEKKVQKTVKLSVTLIHQAYTSLPFEIKVACSAQVLYMFLVDDIAEEFMEDLETFSQNFVLNKNHQHPLLNHFDSHLRCLSHYYGPYCHSAILKSVFDYINGRIIEHKMERSSFVFPADSRLMPMFLRTKVGGAEILVHMLWPKTLFPEEYSVIQYFPIVAELVMFIDFTNDILSYYKESILDNEKRNFVSNFAVTHHLQELDVLRYLATYTPQVLASVYGMLKDHQELRKLVAQFVEGWVMLGTAHRRYHLVELFQDDQYLPSYDEDS